MQRPDPRDLCHECGYQRGTHDGLGGGPCAAFMDCDFCGCQRGRLVGRAEGQDEFVDEKGHVWRILRGEDFSPGGWSHVPLDGERLRREAHDKWNATRAP